MTDRDAILVRVLAHSDAVLLPIREWDGFTNQNRSQALRSGDGIPFRINTRTDEGARKANERTLMDMATAGLLTVGRGPRIKYPKVKLTPAGDARARALAGLPDRKEGRAFLACLAAMRADYPCWVGEVAFTGGKGWGLGASREDRALLAGVELVALPALFAGWVETGSTIHGNVGYAATAAGLAELADPSKPPGGRLPAASDEAFGLYRRECDLKLIELRTKAPDRPSEIGMLPIVPETLLRRDADPEDDGPAESSGYVHPVEGGAV